MVDIKDLHPIGIGTWIISKATYDKDVKGLLYSFEKGQNMVECNASYLAGESLDGYGNLANVSDGDFENICDDLMRIVEQNYVEEDEM